MLVGIKLKLFFGMRPSRIISAKFVESDGERAEREDWEVEQKRREDLALAEAELKLAKAEEKVATKAKNVAITMKEDAGNQAKRFAGWKEKSANAAKIKQTAAENANKLVEEIRKKAKEMTEQGVNDIAVKEKAKDAALTKKTKRETDYVKAENAVYDSQRDKKQAVSEAKRVKNVAVKAYKTAVKAFKKAENDKRKIDQADNKQALAETASENAKNQAQKSDEAENIYTEAQTVAATLSRIADEKIKETKAAQEAVTQLEDAMSDWAKEQVRLAKEEKEAEKQKKAEKKAEEEAKKKAEEEAAEEAEEEAVVQEDEEAEDTNK